MTKRLIGIILIALLIPAPVANAKSHHARSGHHAHHAHHHRSSHK
jgi:hypothetical protein